MNLPTPNTNKSSNNSLKSIIITQAIASVFFILLPVGITLMTPFTDLEFTNSDNGTSVKVTRYALMFLPWKTEEVNNVTNMRADIKDRERYANTSENRRKGRAGAVSVATGQLVIESSSPELKVQCDPELAKSSVEEFKKYTESKNQEALKLKVYASWSLSYILGGIMTFLCAFYVFGCLVSIIKLPFK